MHRRLSALGYGAVAIAVGVSTAATAGAGAVPDSKQQASLLQRSVLPGATVRADSPPSGAFLTVAFWISFIVLLIALFEDRNAPDADEVEIDGPRFVRFLFHNTRSGLFWLPIRLFVGFAWIEAGWHKVTDPEWTQGGVALRAYWERAAQIPEQGRPPITYEWYRDFIQFLLNGGHETWFSYLVMYGEMAIGIGLIL